MKAAKSMYFGGDIVSAEECDYNSYERLGLKCPFCDHPVFLRAASTRKIKEVETQIVAYFAHFRSTTVFELDCEARSTSTSGKERIEQIKTEARNQRLKIYNDKLWYLLSYDRGISKNYMTSMKKSMGERWITNFTKLVRKDLAANLTDLYKSMDLAIEVVKNVPIESLPKSLVNDESKNKYLAQQNYSQTCDSRLHRSICYEVLQFLSTNSGIWTLTKLVTMAPGFHEQFEKMHPDRLKEKLTPKDFTAMLAYFLTSVRWAELIDRSNNQK